MNYKEKGKVMTTVDLIKRIQELDPLEAMVNWN